VSATLTPVQVKLRERARALAEAEIAPRAAEVDASEAYPWDNVRALTRAGFMGMTIPKAYGGRGLSYLDAVLVIEEMAKVCGVTARIVVEGNMGAIDAIMAYGSEEQKRLAAELVLAGDKPAICISEPGAGSAATEMTTRADQRGDHYILNGRKHWITGGGVSRLHLIFARVFDEFGIEQGIGAFIVVRDAAARPKDANDRLTLHEILREHGIEASPGNIRRKLRKLFSNRHRKFERWTFERDSPDYNTLLKVLGIAPGLVVGAREPAMGLRGLPETEIVLDDLEVAAEMALVPPKGLRHGFAALMNAYNAQRVGAATVALGIAEGAFRLALAYSQEREQFGRPICEFQGLQWMLADMSTRISAARALIHEAAAGDGFPDVLAAAQAKIFASEMAIQVTNDALQIFGAAGYSRTRPLERMVRDARMFAIGGGTVQILRTVVASRLLGRKLPQSRDGYVKLMHNDKGGAE
jgi:alkylation response protein AidB-like acyl-CoA dehydrogenase